MKKSHRTKKSQAGATMIEIMIVVVVGLIIVVAAVALGRDGSRSSKTSAEVNGVSQLFSRVPGLRSNSGYGANNADLIPALRLNKMIPAQFTDSGSGLVNQYGGAVQVTSTGVGYRLVDAGLPAEACAAVAQRMSSSAVTTSINGGAAITGEVTSAVAATQCNSASNTVTFTSDV